MTKEQKIKLAAKAAIVVGLGLALMSALALAQVAPLGGAQGFAPAGLLMGFFNVALGVSKLRGHVAL